jgi:hypothetical protein
MSRHARSTAFALTCLLVVTVMTPAIGETPFPSGLTIELLPDYTHQPLQGIDSIVGKVAKKNGTSIQYEIGGAVKPGAPRFGGSYTNYAQQMPAEQREWLKEHKVGGRKVSVAYGKDQRLVVSTEFEKVGINFTAVAKTPEEIADVLMMALSVAEAPKKKVEKAEQ